MCSGWKGPSTRVLSEIVWSKNQSMMAWGDINVLVKGHWHFCDGKTHAEKYSGILKEYINCLQSDMFSQRWHQVTFCSYSSSELTPAYSLDLFPTENMQRNLKWKKSDKDKRLNTLRCICRKHGAKIITETLLHIKKQTKKNNPGNMLDSTVWNEVKFKISVKIWSSSPGSTFGLMSPLILYVNNPQREWRYFYIIVFSWSVEVLIENDPCRWAAGL